MNRTMYVISIISLLAASILIKPSFKTLLIVSALGFLITDSTNSVVIKGLTIIILIFIIFMLIQFKSYIVNRNNFNRIVGDETLIIPGAQIISDKSSIGLKLRLDKSFEILKKFPDIKCIVTGGQGSDEDYPESYVMKKYLIEKGISADRIFMEDKSTDTIQNFKYSKDIILEKSLNKNIIITTNSFHAYRCEIIAKKFGLNPLAVSCENEFLKTSIAYPLREVLSHLKVILYFMTI